MITPKKILYTVLLIVTVACSNSHKEKNNDITSDKNSKYGGVLKLNNEFNFRNLFPLSLTETVSHRIGNQIYESLTTLSTDSLELKPCLAESWEISDDVTTFTFHLRKGVKFHDDPCFTNGKGRELTAHDIKYCYDKLCEYASYNYMFWLFQNKVKGANEYYEATKNGEFPEGGVEGIKVIDDYTLQIELNFPFAILPKILTHSAFWIYPREAFEKYGEEMRVHPVGTGPFMPKKIKENETVILQRNPNYWGKDKEGNQLPYLDAVKFSFLKDPDIIYLEFQKKNFDFTNYIGTFSKEINQAAKENKIKLHNIPAMGSGYFGFQCQQPPFNNKLVRQAFAAAIDIKKISEYMGRKNQKIRGIVPPMKNYPFYKTAPIPYSPEQARKLLKKAGYETPDKFPKVKLSISGGYNGLAEITQKMLNDNLHINIEIENFAYSKLMELAETGNLNFWMTGWLADYPDPENFLNLLYGKNVPDNPNKRSFINPFRYKSPVFDDYFKTALQTPDVEKRNDYYQKADQTAIQDAAVIPYEYSSYSMISHNYVKNLYFNGMKYFDFSEVYIDKNDQTLPANDKH